LLIASTDGAGVCLSIALRPVTYTLTFTRPDFARLKRRPSVLEGQRSRHRFNGFLAVGIVGDTVTVTCASSRSRQKTIARRTMRSLNRQVLALHRLTRRLCRLRAALVPGSASTARDSQHHSQGGPTARDGEKSKLYYVVSSPQSMNIRPKTYRTGIHSKTPCVSRSTSWRSRAWSNYGRREGSQTVL